MNRYLVTWRDAIGNRRSEMIEAVSHWQAKVDSAYLWRLDGVLRVSPRELTSKLMVRDVEREAAE